MNGDGARPRVPAPPVAAAPPLRRSWSLAALLAALSMLGPFSVDTYLPAFPAIGSALGASPLELQQTLSTYLFAFAFMMLWHGALSDALGRRPIVIAGLVVYAVATLGCAIAGNIESLWLFRALQGLSAGAGVVIGRAIIRDRFHGSEAQKLMSQTTLVFGVAPAVAPVLGGLLLNAFGWRSIFWTLFAFTLAVLAWTAAKLPETLPPAARQPLHPQVMARNYRAVLTRVDFLLLALIPALNLGGFFIYIAAAPAFLLDLLGLTTRGFAWLFVPMIAGVVIGALLSGRLAGRLSPQRTIRLGYAVMAGGVAINVLVSGLAPPIVPLAVLPVLVFAAGSSIVMPSTMLLMLDLFPAMRGLASSLQGFVHFALSGVNAAIIAPFLVRSRLTMALGMAAFAGASFALWLIYQRRARAHLKGWTP
jgi:DHA1 family bicyclomycin/chloramphenicol resistance-like MFS transporter